MRGLQRLGHEVELCGPDFRGSRSHTGHSPGWVGLLKKHLPKPLYTLAELGYSIVAYRQLARTIRAFQPDVIYERYNLFELSGIWAKNRFSLPLILEVNAPMARERQQYNGLSMPWLARWTENWVWRKADQVLPITRVLADELEQCGVQPQQITIVPNGINPDQYEGLPSIEAAKRLLGLENRLVIGFTGFVREWDRLDRVVKWMASYQGKETLHLLVVGDGPARAEIEACAHQYGISDQVSFTGVVKRQEVPAAAMAFDIALQTALVPYASPLCLFEYLALGKAILAPDQPNHHEILRDRIDALLYDPEAAHGLEQGLDALVNNIELRNDVAKHAVHVIADKKLTWTDHARTIEGLFHKLLAQRRK